MSEEEGPRVTRAASKRGLGEEEDDAPPPLKSGLTQLFGSAGLGAEEPQKAKRAKAGMNDKVQQKKWANKRDEIRAKKKMAADAEAELSAANAQPEPSGASAAAAEESMAVEEEAEVEAPARQSSRSSKAAAGPSEEAEEESRPSGRREVDEATQKMLDGQKAFVEALDDVMSLRFVGKAVGRMRGKK